MRMMMYVSFPVETFNAAARDGSVGGKIQAILEAQKPESVYFTDLHGKRTAVIVVEIAEATQIPAMAEPWFLAFHAGIEMHPVMVPADLAAAGLEGLAKTWG